MPASLDRPDFTTWRVPFVLLFIAVGTLTSVMYGVAFGPLALVVTAPAGFGLGWTAAASLCRGLSGTPLRTFLTTNPLTESEYPHASV